MISNGGPGLPQGNDLRMSSGIGVGEVAIETSALLLAFMDDDSAHRNFRQSPVRAGLIARPPA